MRKTCICLNSHRHQSVTILTKIQMEVYFDMIIANCLQMFILFNPGSFGHKIKDFFSNTDDTVSSILALIYLPFVFCLPWVIGYIIGREISQGTLLTNKGNQVLIEGLRTSVKHKALFNHYFLVRRLFMTLILVMLSFWPAG
jgi:hypothetical protein